MGPHRSKKWLLLAAICQLAVHSRSTVPEYNISGTIYLAALFDAHFPTPEALTNCSESINIENAVMSQAFLWSLNKANMWFKRMSKSITLGAYMIDSCSSEPLVLQRSVQFVPRSFCSPDKHRWSLKTPRWKTTGQAESQHCADEVNDIVAVTGAFASNVARDVSFLTQGFCIPVIAADTSAATLDEASRFPFFMRACPSDYYQAQMVHDILMEMRWFHVTVIYEVDEYGYGLKTTFEQLLKEETLINTRSTDRICIENFLDVSNADWYAIKSRFYIKNQAPVVLLFMHWNTAQNMFEQLQKQSHGPYASTTIGPKQKFQFVWVDGADTKVPAHFAGGLLEGTIGTFPMAKRLPEFTEHLLSLSIDQMNNTTVMSPWIAEYIQKAHNCCMDHGGLTHERNTRVDVRPSACTSGVKLCTGAETFDDKSSAHSEIIHRKPQLIYDTVMLLTSAIYELHEKFCTDSPQICGSFSDNVTGSMLYEEIKRLVAKDSQGYRWLQNETSHGLFYKGSNSGTPNYLIKQWVNGSWHHIGRYETPDEDDREKWQEPKLYLAQRNITKMRWWRQPDGLCEQLEQCMPPCPRGYYENLGQCCVRCENCTQLFEHYDSASGKCARCPAKTKPTPDRQNCTAPSPDSVLRPAASLYVLFAVCLLGIVAAGGSLYVTVAYYSTPIMSASAPSLCALQCCVLVALFGSQPMQLPSSSTATCTLGWATSTTLLALAHSVGMVKAVRLCRPRWYVALAELVQGWLAKYDLEPKWKPLVSALPSAILLSITTVVHLVIVQIWTLWTPATISVEPHLDTENFYYWCSVNSDGRTIILMLCPVAYLLMSGVFLKRSLGNPFVYPADQAKYAIAGWFSFIVLYTAAAPMFFLQPQIDVSYRAAVIMCISIITGIIFWASMLLPVVHMVLRHAELNNAAYVARKRSHHFKEGNVLYFVDAVLMPKIRKRSNIRPAVQEDSGGVEAQGGERPERQMLEVPQSADGDCDHPRGL